MACVSFKQVPLFEDTNLPFIRLLCTKVKPAHFHANEYIVRKGDIGQEMFIIRKGLVRSFMWLPIIRLGPITRSILNVLLTYIVISPNSYLMISLHAHYYLIFWREKLKINKLMITTQPWLAFGNNVFTIVLKAIKIRCNSKGFFVAKFTSEEQRMKSIENKTMT